MTNNIESIVKQSRARFDHEAHREILKQKYQAKMIFAYRDGLWQAGPELLTALYVCQDEDVVLLDLYENPIAVNVEELTEQAYSCWQEQMNAWNVEFEKARQQR